MARTLPEDSAPLSLLASLEAASRRDYEEMLCFMRSLDEDDDGYVTLEGFCDAVLGKRSRELSTPRKMHLASDTLD